MLHFSQLNTPPNHGDVLVAPSPPQMAAAARANHRALGRANVRLLDSTLAACRRQTRQSLVGSDEGIVIVTGHQPAFIHPGVWAKHVVAMRLARALDGVAVNLVVDSDAAATTTLEAPGVSENGLHLRHIAFADVRSGLPYELFARQSDNEIADFEQGVREALGAGYETSMMPAFFRGVQGAKGDADWVDQSVAGRRAVEAALKVEVIERRVSEVWCSPLLLEMIVHAEAFAASYNRALSRYRQANRIRGAQRPIPDLHIDNERCETALWAYRPGEARRRLFVRQRKGECRMWADDVEIGAARIDQLARCGGLETLLSDCRGWRLRPRALSLTLWARLLLADLFIHGIGGAKYDRITDMIIEDYFGIAPPAMACVSATLHMDLPDPEVSEDTLRGLRHAARDLVYNPQRNLTGGDDLEVLVQERVALVQRSQTLRASDRANRRARAETSRRIREVNQALLDRRPEALSGRQRAVIEASGRLVQARIARGRTYFFGLYDRARLAALCEALPDEGAFRL